MLIEIKNNKFLSLKFNLYLNFLINSTVITINGKIIPICFNRNIIGYRKWSIKFEVSNPDLANPYVIVIKSFLNTKFKKVIFIIAIIAMIELSGHGIFASLFRFLNSLN